jgi:hypothetical protein
LRVRNLTCRRASGRGRPALAVVHFSSPDSSYLEDVRLLPQFFPSKTYVRYLRELPQRRGLLLNLLFSNDVKPSRALLAVMPPPPAPPLVRSR